MMDTYEVKDCRADTLQGWFFIFQDGGNRLISKVLFQAVSIKGKMHEPEDKSIEM
jgi:hypothetical protein